MRHFVQFGIIVILLAGSCSGKKTRIDSKSKLINVDGKESIFTTGPAEQIENEHARTLYFQGISLASKGNFTESIEKFNEALSYEPESWYINTNKAIAFMEMEDYTKAENCFIKAINLSDSLQSLPFLNFAILQMRTKKFKEAIITSNLALKLSKNRLEKFSIQYTLVSLYVFSSECIKARSGIQYLRKLNVVDGKSIRDITGLEILVHQCK